MSITFNNPSQLLEKIQRDNINLNDYLIGHEGYAECGNCKYYLVAKDRISTGEQAHNPEKLAYVAAVLMADIEHKLGIKQESYEKWMGTAEKINNFVKNINVDATSDWALFTKNYIKNAQNRFESIQAMREQEGHKNNVANQHTTASTQSATEEHLSTGARLPVAQAASTQSTHVSTAERLPVAHKGMSCFINTALQVLAHIGTYRNLLNPELNPLKPREGESTDSISFKARVMAQSCLHFVLKALCEGRLISDPISIIKKINQALEEMGSTVRYNWQTGGDPHELIRMITDICGSDPFVTFTPSQLANHNYHKSLKVWQTCNNTQALPSVFVLRNNGEEIKLNNPTEFTIEAKDKDGKVYETATYRLEAIEGGLTGHAVPWLRTEEGNFVQINDMATKNTIVGAEKAAELLSKKSGWYAAQYVRVSTD